MIGSPSQNHQPSYYSLREQDVDKSSRYSVTIDGGRQHYAKGNGPFASLFFNEHLTRLFLKDPTQRNVWAERGALMVDSGYCPNVFFRIGYNLGAGSYNYQQIHADSNSHVFLSYDSTASLALPKRRWMVQGDTNLAANVLYADTSSSINLVRAWWSYKSGDTCATTSRYTNTEKYGTASNIINMDTARFGNVNLNPWSDNKIWYCDENRNLQEYKHGIRELVARIISPHDLNVFPVPVSLSHGGGVASVTLALTLAEGSPVDLAIYDPKGVLLFKLASYSWLDKGVYFFHWNGKGDSRFGMASGTYYAAARTEQGITVAQIAIVK